MYSQNFEEQPDLTYRAGILSSALNLRLNLLNLIMAPTLKAHKSLVRSRREDLHELHFPQFRVNLKTGS
jgi:hypothetical protein